MADQDRNSRLKRSVGTHRGARKIKSIFSFVNQNRPPTPEEFVSSQRTTRNIDQHAKKQAFDARARNRMSTRAIAFWSARRAKELSEMDRQMVQESREMAAKYRPRLKSFKRRSRANTISSDNPLCDSTDDDDGPVLYLTPEQLPRLPRSKPQATPRQKSSFSNGDPFRSAVQTWKLTGSYILEADSAEMSESESSTSQLSHSPRSIVSRKSRRRMFGSGASVRNGKASARKFGSGASVRNRKATGDSMPTSYTSRMVARNRTPSVASRVASKVSSASMRISRRLRGTSFSSRAGDLTSLNGYSSDSHASGTGGESDHSVGHHVSTAAMLQLTVPDVANGTKHRFAPHTPKSSVVSSSTEEYSSSSEEEEEGPTGNREESSLSDSSSDAADSSSDNGQQNDDESSSSSSGSSASSTDLELHSRPSSVEDTTDWLVDESGSTSSSEESRSSSSDEESSGSESSSNGSDDSSEDSESGEDSDGSDGYMGGQSDDHQSDEELGLEAIDETEDEEEPEPYERMERYSRLSFLRNIRRSKRSIISIGDYPVVSTEENTQDSESDDDVLSFNGSGSEDDVLSLNDSESEEDTQRGDDAKRGEHSQSEEGDQSLKSTEIEDDAQSTVDSERGDDAQSTKSAESLEEKQNAPESDSAEHAKGPEEHTTQVRSSNLDCEDDTQGSAADGLLSRSLPGENSKRSAAASVYSMLVDGDLVVNAQDSSSDEYSEAASTVSGSESSSNDEGEESGDVRDSLSWGREVDLLELLDEDTSQELGSFSSKRLSTKIAQGPRLWSATSSTIHSSGDSGESTSSETSSRVRRNSRRRRARNDGERHNNTPGFQGSGRFSMDEKLVFENVAETEEV